MSTPQHLSDRYELGEILGFGGMSEVHLARDVRLHRDVAVKVLRADLARDPSFYLRFRREAQNAAALNHPAIVAVYDTGEAETPSGPLPYIVMEYVDGVTLRDIVHNDGPMPPRRALEVIGGGTGGRRAAAVALCVAVPAAGCCGCVGERATQLVGLAAVDCDVVAVVAALKRADAVIGVAGPLLGALAVGQ
jgi:hypothetical protein